jgi:hypothetical protein
MNKAIDVKALKSPFFFSEPARAIAIAKKNNDEIKSPKLPR